MLRLLISSKIEWMKSTIITSTSLELAVSFAGSEDVLLLEESSQREGGDTVGSGL